MTRFGGPRRLGVNAKALPTYMGYANVWITLDRYGHLMPGNEDEAAGLLCASTRPAQATPPLGCKP